MPGIRPIRSRAKSRRYGICRDTECNNVAVLPPPLANRTRKFPSSVFNIIGRSRINPTSAGGLGRGHYLDADPLPAPSAPTSPASGGGEIFLFGPHRDRGRALHHRPFVR